MFRRNPLLAVFGAAFLAIALTSCGSPSIPNAGRVLLAILVTPAQADALGGQVVFTANGTFSVAPSPAPVTFAAPYAGGFTVATIGSNQEIATIVSTWPRNGDRAMCCWHVGDGPGRGDCVRQ
jgi:hypothetical protein